MTCKLICRNRYMTHIDILLSEDKQLLQSTELIFPIGRGEYAKLQHGTINGINCHFLGSNSMECHGYILGIGCMQLDGCYCPSQVLALFHIWVGLAHGSALSFAMVHANQMTLPKLVWRLRCVGAPKVPFF